MAAQTAAARHTGTTTYDISDAGQKVGFSIIQIYEPSPNGKLAQIQYFRIKKDMRGCGLGRKCYIEMESMLRNEGVDMIELMPLDSTCGFWEKMGYNIKNGAMLKKDLKVVK
jgi:ribosomal protein S18 acetylase RimI-like enzyme